MVLAFFFNLTFETACMAHGGSIWSLSGPQSQDNEPEERHSSWRWQRDKTRWTFVHYHYRVHKNKQTKKKWQSSPSPGTTHNASLLKFWSSCGRRDTWWSYSQLGSSRVPLSETRRSRKREIIHLVFLRFVWTVFTIDEPRLLPPVFTHSPIHNV